MMLMDKLGYSLEDLLVRKNGKLSLKTVLMVGIQLIDRIKYIHQRGFLHRDIKPDNLLMGLGSKSKTMFIIDMGLSKKYFIKESTSFCILKGTSPIRKERNSLEQQDMPLSQPIKGLSKAGEMILKQLDTF